MGLSASTTVGLPNLTYLTRQNRLVTSSSLLLLLLQERKKEGACKPTVIFNVMWRVFYDHFHERQREKTFSSLLKVEGEAEHTDRESSNITIIIIITSKTDDDDDDYSYSYATSIGT